MNSTHVPRTPFRAIPVAFALIFNVVAGPIAPLLQSQIAALAPARAMGYVGSPTFELDGNIDSAAGIDWDKVKAGTSGADNTQFDTDLVNSNSDDIFTGGGSKDQQLLQSGPWLWTTSKPQPKDDITHAFAAAYTIGGHTIAYFGLDKYEVDGDNQVGFWFFKNGIAKTNTSFQGGLKFSGEHSVGDILVLADYTNGGTVPNVKVYKWVGSGGSDGTVDLISSVDNPVCGGSAQYVCGITNSADFTSSAWTYKNRDAAAGDWPAGALFEGGLDLTHFGLDTGCFSSFLAETRSSQAITATLSDFTLGSFSFCAPPTIETQVSASSINMGESVTDTATLSGSKGAVEGSVDFFVCGPTNSAQDCTTGGTPVGTAPVDTGEATSASFTPTAAGFYCFRAEYTPAAGSKYQAASHTNDTTECFQVLPAAIHVAKSADAASVSAGEPIGFTVTVSNSGTGTAKGVTLSDSLPAGNSGSPVHWAIDGGADAASFVITGADGSQQLNLGSQPISVTAGASLAVHIAAATTSDNCATYDNTASVSTTNDGSDQASATTAVLCPVINVTKTADADSVSAGSAIGFTVTVSNSGAGKAFGVTLADALPAGNSSAPVHWAIDGSTGNPSAFAISGLDGSQALSLVGQPITLNAGASLAVHIIAATDADNCAVYDNTASVATTNDGQDQASDSTEVLCPDIQVTKVADAGSVSAGTSIGFTVTVSNAGDGNATGVTLSDPLPGGKPATPVHWTIDGSTGNPSAFAITGADGSQVVSLAGQPITLNAGASLTVHIVAATSFSSCGTYDNTASVSAGNDGSDQASASTAVLCPNLFITKAPDPESGLVSAGQPIGFSIVVGNKGDGTATAVTLNDPLPTGADLDWEINPAYSGQGSCAITGLVGSEVLSCSLGDLVSGTMVQVHIVSNTTSADCSTFHNVASASATNHPTVTASADITVECPGINVAKSAAVSPIHGGDDASFTVIVWNHGDGSDLNASLNDPLPAGESGALDWKIDPAYSGPGTCAITGNPGDQTLSCSFGDLPGGTSQEHPSASITVVAKTSPADDCATLENTASVSADNDETREASASIELLCPQLVIEKAADIDQIHFVFNANGSLKSVTPADRTVTWTLTYTLTDGPVTNAVICDPLPDFLSYVDGSASNGGHLADGSGGCQAGDLEWDLGTLSSSGVVSFKTTVDVDAPDGQIENVAVISSDQTPEDEGRDHVNVTSESVEAATPTPKASVPNTAVVFGPSGQPIQIPVELVVVLFLTSLGALALVNVRAVRRRR